MATFNFVLKGFIIGKKGDWTSANGMFGVGRGCMVEKAEIGQ